MRLIDADAMRREWLENGENEYVYDTNAVLDSIDEQPTLDLESLRPKGHWNIRCESHRDNYTGEVDEEFYLECSECKRTVWNIDQSAALSGEERKLTEQYPYCHCGAKMEG